MSRGVLLVYDGSRAEVFKTAGVCVRTRAPEALRLLLK